MNTTLLSVLLKTKRDILRIRQLTYRAADLLGFSTSDQVRLAAAVFDLACQAKTPTGRARVCFEVVDGWLRVTCSLVAKAPRRRRDHGTTALVVNKRLVATRPLADEDVGWTLRQFQEMAPLDVFEEMQRINQDLLGALLELSRLGETTSAKMGESNAA